jgi:hypothetical protein
MEVPGVLHMLHSLQQNEGWIKRKENKRGKMMMTFLALVILKKAPR